MTSSPRWTPRREAHQARKIRPQKSPSPPPRAQNPKTNDLGCDEFVGVKAHGRAPLRNFRNHTDNFKGVDPMTISYPKLPKDIVVRITHQEVKEGLPVAMAKSI